jgi:hypothetical protein
MLGRPIFEPTSEELKAEYSAEAILAVADLELNEELQERIVRNAKHLQQVIEILNISETKRAEYQNLIDTYLVD